MEEVLFGSLFCFFILAGSLCKRKTPECDKETSICTDLDGVALCQCKSGYFQFNKMDHSCRGTSKVSEGSVARAGTGKMFFSALGVTVLN